MNLKLGQQARQDGSALTAEGISELKHAIKGKVVVRGEAEEEEYKDSITRWNKVYIQQSVRYLIASTAAPCGRVFHG